MAIYPVEIKFSYNADTLFAVFNSTTDTLFAPTWAESDGGELAAHMFAYQYDMRRTWGHSADAQSALAYDIHCFILAHGLKEGSAPVPADWRAKWYSDDRRSTTIHREADDVYDLVNAFEHDQPAASLLMDEFYAWQKRIHAEAK